MKMDYLQHFLIKYNNHMRLNNIFNFLIPSSVVKSVRITNNLFILLFFLRFKNFLLLFSYYLYTIKYDIYFTKLINWNRRYFRTVLNINVKFDGRENYFLRYYKSRIIVEPFPFRKMDVFDIFGSGTPGTINKHSGAMVKRILS